MAGQDARFARSPPPFGRVRRRAVVIYSTPRQAMPVDLAPEAWHLVTPIGVERTVELAIDLPVGERGATWQAYAYRDGEYVAAELVEPGEALWFIHTENEPFSLPHNGFLSGNVESGCLGEGRCRKLELEPGVALVGNPFDEPVAFDELGVRDSDACVAGCTFDEAANLGLIADAFLTWSGEAYVDPRTDDRTALEPGEGGWISVLEPDVALLLPGPGTASITVADVPVAATDWIRENEASTATFREDWSGVGGFVTDEGLTDAIRVLVRQGENFGAAEYVDLPGRPREVVMQYRLLVPPFVETRWRAGDANLKLPGLAGDVSASNGGFGGSQDTERPHEDRAWSARQALHRPGTSSPSLAAGAELYWQGSDNEVNGFEFGDNEWYSPSGAVGSALTVETGRWVEVKVHVRVNEADADDGFIRTYLDGELGLEIAHLAWTRAADMTVVKRLWLDVYHGGSAKATAGTLIFYFRDFRYTILE